MSSIARKPKATFARGIDKFVLASLAFEIALDLRLSGLPNIDYRFAFQHRSGSKLSARHRHPFQLRRRPPPTAGWPVVRALCCVQRDSHRARRDGEEPAPVTTGGLLDESVSYEAYCKDD